MTSQEQEQIIAAIDEAYANRQAVLDAKKAALKAENKAAKMLIAALFQLQDSVNEAGSRSSSNGNSLMTLQDTANFTGYSPRTIQQWIADGDFPDLRAKEGADPRFDRAEILNHMKKHRKNLRGEAAASGKVSPLQRDCKQKRSKANVSL